MAWNTFVYVSDTVMSQDGTFNQPASLYNQVFERFQEENILLQIKNTPDEETQIEVSQKNDSLLVLVACDFKENFPHGGDMAHIIEWWWAEYYRKWEIQNKQ